MRLIPTYTWLYMVLAITGACTPLEREVSEDIIKGEISVVEQAVNDVRGVQPTKPAVGIKILKY